MREWRKTAAVPSRDPAVIAEKTREWRAAHPEAFRAHRAVEWAVYSGRLRREPCRLCGARRVEAHHPDYTRRLHVVWLCRSCHLRVSAEERAGLQRFTLADCAEPGPAHGRGHPLMRASRRGLSADEAHAELARRIEARQAARRSN
jgi:hypothetical protein